HFGALYSVSLNDNGEVSGGTPHQHAGNPLLDLNIALGVENPCIALSEADSPLFFFSMEDTLEAINSLKPLKTPGLDGIPGDLYKSDPQVWAGYINLLSNAIVSGGRMPATWKGAEIIPV
ncbi:hypothetical protein NDU88_005748, partial [Pleurodeles waltl]